MPPPSALFKTKLLQLDNSPSSGRNSGPFRAEFNQDFHFGLLAAHILRSCKWFAITILAVDGSVPSGGRRGAVGIEPTGALTPFPRAFEVKVTIHDDHTSVHLHFGLWLTTGVNWRRGVLGGLRHSREPRTSKAEVRACYEFRLMKLSISPISSELRRNSAAPIIPES